MSPATPGPPLLARQGTVGLQKRQINTRARVIAGMVQAAATSGYAGASVTEVMSQGNVSRSSFYMYFEDRDDCFSAALADVSEGLCSRVQEAVEGAPEPCYAVMNALVEFACEESAAAVVLFGESLAAGNEAGATRLALIEQISGMIESEWERAEGDPLGPDIPAGAFVGGLFRLLCIRLRSGVGGLHGLPLDLEAWVNAYTPEEAEGGPYRWRDRSGPALSARWSPPAVIPDALHSLGPLPAGRHGLDPSEVASSQRERLMLAAARTAWEKGYPNVSVTDIVAAAQVSRNVFYANFPDKRAAALAALQLNFELAMTSAARAFFKQPQWPERIWATACALERHFLSHPELAHLGFVELHAIGPEGPILAQERMMAFTLLFEEGYRQSAAAETLPRTTSEAVQATIYELAYLDAPRPERSPRARKLTRPGLHAQRVYIALAPFIGPSTASKFVTQKLAKASHSRS
jgi:AcrR family transcriptional regulator